MSNPPHRHTPAHAQWGRVRLLERLMTVGVWLVAAGFVWAGIRAWSAGAGITMMLIALAVCVAAAWGLPHLRRAVFRATVSGGDVDEQWRRFDTR